MPERTGGIQSAGWRRLGGEGGLPPEGPASAGPRIMPPPWLMRPSVKATHCGLWAVSASPSPGSVLASGLRQSDSEGLAPTRTSMPTQENRPPAHHGGSTLPASQQPSLWAVLSVFKEWEQPLGPRSQHKVTQGTRARIAAGFGLPRPWAGARPPGLQVLSQEMLSHSQLSESAPTLSRRGHGEVGAMFQDPSHENGLRIPLFLAPELHIPVSSTPGAKAPINIRSHQPSHS